jgi:excinuclease ABC subunit C
MKSSIPNLKSKILNLPQKPGVYQFLDKNGGVIYIGKAKNLRARVRQYFSGQDERPQIPYLINDAADFSYTVVNNELESLYLENTLIKQYLPKYNILLRDDKNYAFIKIDYSTEVPQIGYARKIDDYRRHSEGVRPTEESQNKRSFTPRMHSGFRMTPNKESKFFGPYTAAYKIRDTLHLTRKIFPYCSAAKVSGKPCFHYHLHRCPGVCIGKISLDEYRQTLKKIEDFLAGNTAKIKKQLQSEMRLASAKKQFEKAARLRDQLNSLKLLDERQTVILAKKVDWDIVSLASSDGYACVNLFKVREGKLQDKENFVYEVKAGVGEGLKPSPTRTNDFVLQTFLEKYYLETSGIPKVIYTQYQTPDENLVTKIIRSRFGRFVKIITPQKGKPKELVKLGIDNAQEYLSKWLSDQAGHLDKINQALEGLRDILKLADIPRRIECYDISNIQGTNAVGSMVVFENGLPAKSQYRKFKIRSKQTPDDFAMMKEMLERRMARASPRVTLGDRGLPSAQQWLLPDLIVIDGGKGQLGIAVETISALGGSASGGNSSLLTINVIGLAKRIEEIFVPGKSEPIILSHDNPVLQLLQRLRDEAHRFGITFHRQLRSKQAVKSALDDIPGIGPKTKKLLKTKFGTVANIKKTPPDELEQAVGKKLAELIQASL